MRTIIVLALLLLALATSASASCWGTVTEVYWTTYHDNWLTGDWLSTFYGPIDIGGDASTDYIEETVEIGDCPPLCTDTAHTISTFTGNNQWMSNVGGTQVFRQISAGSYGLNIAIDFNGNVFGFDPIDQVWQQMPGSFDTSTILAIGDIDSVYALQETALYRYNSNGYWDQLTGSSGIVEIATTAGGILYGRASNGQMYEWWNGSWQTSALPMLSGMAQFSIASNDVGNAIGANTATTYAIANGGMYYLIYGYPWRWSYLPTPFTPAEVRASTNAAVALDTNGQIWTLASLSGTDYPDGQGGWYTILSATWNQGPQLPAATTHITAGGPSDIYAYGPSISPYRLFPNSTVKLDWSGYEDDFVYSGSSMLAALPSSLPDDWDFMSTGSARVTRQCRGGLPYDIIATAWALSQKPGGRPGGVGTTYFCDSINATPFLTRCGYVCTNTATGNLGMYQWGLEHDIRPKCHMPPEITTCPRSMDAHKVWANYPYTKLEIDTCYY